MTLTHKSDHDSSLAPVPDPGLEHHVERYTDVDDRAGKRAYLQVVTMFALVPVLVPGSL